MKSCPCQRQGRPLEPRPDRQELLQTFKDKAMVHVSRVVILYTLWLCQNSYWKWPLIVDFPIKNGDFSIAMLVYQRVITTIVD